MSVGTAFHPRTAQLNRKMQWREWSGYFASSVYADAHDIEYNAIREAAALIDVSPLYKYRIAGPDATRLVDRVITRDASKVAVGQVVYTPWCDEHGKVIDDGTVHRLAEQEYRWTAADPQYRWLSLNARGLDVEISDTSEAVAAVALQGPFSRAVLEAVTREDFSDLRYFRRRSSAIRIGGRGTAAGGRVRKVAVDVSRTGYTGDLGYELWIPADEAVAAWDALVEAGAPYGIRPAGMLALDVVRLEAGLILLEVDYTSARHALNPEQNYSPYEIGLGRLVDLGKGDFVGKLALAAEQAKGGPARRLVGVALDWYGIEGLFSAQDLPPAISPAVDRRAVPVFGSRGGGQIGKLTSHGWSPILKQAIGLASVPAAYERPGSTLEVEWTVEGRRGRVEATVVPVPFLDLARKRA
jgi:aminomethyltransferase